MGGNYHKDADFGRNMLNHLMLEAKSSHTVLQDAQSNIPELYTLSTDAYLHVRLIQKLLLSGMMVLMHSCCYKSIYTSASLRNWFSFGK